MKKIKNKKAEADSTGTQLPKQALFDKQNHIFLGRSNRIIVAGNRAKLHIKAMQLTLIGINANQ